jgi:benzodiazapine receptor
MNSLATADRKARVISAGLKTWQIMVLTLGVTVLGGLSTLLSRKRRLQAYTKELKQAPWAPPAWLFSPAWTFINFFVINALKEIIAKEDTKNRKTLLYLQLAIWSVYFTADYILFRKKSPVLTAIWTKADAGFAIASLILAARENKKLSLKYLPLSLWTLYAGTVADYQALKNPDKVLETVPALSSR